MKILVTGATGLIGRHLVDALGEQGHELVLTSRTGRGPRHIAKEHDWRAIDFMTAHSPADWQQIVVGVEVVINAVGIFSPTKRQSFRALHDEAPRALFAAAQKAGVRRIVQISALGADEDASSDYHLSKRAADDALTQIDIESVILRPSLIIGGEGESWRFFKALALLPVVPVIGDGKQPLQPVTITDVVQAVIAAVDREDVAGSRINLVGRETVTHEAYLRLLARWMGCKKFRSLHIPYALAGHFAAAAWLFDDLPLNRAAVSMLKEAREFEAHASRSKLGFVPMGVSEFLQRNPPSRADIVDARQYFLRGILRIALAFMWIMAGVVSIFFHPVEQSLQLLAKLGLSGTLGTVSLYGAALMDIALGLLLLARFHVRKMALFQIGLIFVYTMALTWAAPGLWSDPFGALVKNVPIIAAIALLMSWEKE